MKQQRTTCACMYGPTSMIRGAYPGKTMFKVNPSVLTPKRTNIYIYIVPCTWIKLQWLTQLNQQVTLRPSFLCWWLIKLAHKRLDACCRCCCVVLFLVVVVVAAVVGVSGTMWLPSTEKNKHIPPLEKERNLQFELGKGLASSHKSKGNKHSGFRKVLPWTKPEKSQT